MSQVVITRKPVLPIIKIEKNDGTFYTFNHFTSTYDFRLRTARIVPVTDGLGGYFQLKIAHPNPSTLLSMAQNIERGNLVKIWVGKSDVSAQTPRFLGVLEKLTFLERSRHWVDLQLTGIDWGSHIEHWRVLNGYYEQRKLGDGLTPDLTDTSTKIKNMIIDFLTNRDRYLFPGVSIQDQGGIISSSNIEDSGRSLDNFKMDGQTAADVLRTLDDEDGMIHYWNGAKEFIRRYPTATPSGILLTDDPKDSIALAWDQAKVGLILPDTSYEINSEEEVAILMGLGGDQTEIDKRQENISLSDTDLITNYWAAKFRPSIRDYVKFQIAVGKVGTPPSDLTVELIEADENGLPLGTVIRKLSIPAAEISTTSDIASDPLMAWRTLVIGDDKLNTAKDHYIVCWKTGGDASNKIVWYRHSSAGASGTSMYSTDLSTWNSDTKQFAFRTYYTTPVLGILVKPGGTSAQDKYFRERVIKKPTITDFQEMYTLLNSQSLYYFNKRHSFRARVYAPDTLLDNLQNVRIRKQKTKYAFDYDDFVASGIEWVFQEGLGAFYFDATFTRFAS